MHTVEPLVRAAVSSGASTSVSSRTSSSRWAACGRPVVSVDSRCALAAAAFSIDATSA
ncbi:hypothetical protein [Mycolicibacterium helvum]|uniref:hypothetical protein n=1 Tax=Mycolicibacterium helvum TaxID=1534349 RepID=UPI0013D3887E|nr:hypothetical protein [Mycolicibacterium helvum]